MCIRDRFRTLSSLQRNVPVFFAGLQAQLEAFFSDNPDVIAYINSVEIDWEQLMQQIVAFLSDGAGTVLSTTFSAAMSIVNGVTCFGIGLILSLIHI